MEHPNGLRPTGAGLATGGLVSGPPTAGSDARHPFFDATTIFPDHVVGRITAIGALAALIRRRRQGVGARIGVSQAEAGINQLETRFVTLAAEASGAGAVEVHRDTAEHLVLACLGEDQWCVVSITSDADRRAIAGLVGDAALWPIGRPCAPRDRLVNSCRPPECRPVR